VAVAAARVALGPFLEALGGRNAPDARAFEGKNRQLEAQASPTPSDGTALFRLQRFFVSIESA
jgi:trans-aconitate methyltransferase